MQRELRFSPRQYQRLCRTITEEVGDGVTYEKMERFKRFLLARVTDTTYARKRHIREVVFMRWGAIAVTASVLIAAIVTIFSFCSEEKSMRFWVGDERDFGTVSQRVDALSGDSVPLYFEQKSRIEVQEKAAVEVVAATLDQVTLKLLKGTISADVQGNGKTIWTVEAGLFRVTVLGTQFRVSWNTAAGSLDVEVTRGTVLVRGAGLSEHGIKVSEGNHLRAVENTNYLALNRVDSTVYDPDSPGLIAAASTKASEPMRPSEHSSNEGAQSRTENSTEADSGVPTAELQPGVKTKQESRVADAGERKQTVGMRTPTLEHGSYDTRTKNHDDNGQKSGKTSPGVFILDIIGRGFTLYIRPGHIGHHPGRSNMKIAE